MVSPKAMPPSELGPRIVIGADAACHACLLITGRARVGGEREQSRASLMNLRTGMHVKKRVSSKQRRCLRPPIMVLTAVGKRRNPAGHESWGQRANDQVQLIATDLHAVPPRPCCSNGRHASDGVRPTLNTHLPSCTRVVMARWVEEVTNLSEVRDIASWNRVAWTWKLKGSKQRNMKHSVSSCFALIVIISRGKPCLSHSQIQGLSRWKTHAIHFLESPTARGSRHRDASDSCSFLGRHRWHLSSQDRHTTVRSLQWPPKLGLIALNSTPGRFMKSPSLASSFPSPPMSK